MDSPITSMDQLGTIPVRVGVSRLDSGQVRVGTNLWDGHGLRFPSYSSSSSPPRAVVRITHSASSGDPLAPRSNDFTLSIYFRKDARSSGTKVDDGDNLMQRGLYGDPAQYKLQVDDGKPSCVIKGDQGRVIVRSSLSVNPNLWYHAECTRTGNAVVLTVKEFRADGTTHTVTTRKSGSIGSLAWPRRQTPIAVGGKLAADGSVMRSTTDQFNGWVTHPLLQISS